MTTRPLHYVLVNGEPRPCIDVVEWAEWFETADRVLAKDRDEGAGSADGVEVSTVFLGLDHNPYGIGPPILWESLVFGGPLDGTMKRYATRDEALAGHQQLCRAVTKG